HFHFEIIPGREVGMSAFAGKRMMPEAIPIESCHPKAGSCRDYRPVPFGIFRAFAQGDEVLRFKRIDPISVGLQIIEQANGTEFELLRQLSRIDGPWKIRNLAAPTSHGPSHANARAVHRYALGSYELRKNHGQPVVLLAEVSFLNHTLQSIAFGFESGEPSACTTDVT